MRDYLMSRKSGIKTALLVISIFGVTNLTAWQPNFSLELASNLIYSDDTPKAEVTALPELTLSREFGFNTISANVQTQFSIDQEADFDAKIYRLWLRHSTITSEVRLGRQQLNFGPAQLLRSLRWFDHLDPNDFLARTTGVNALSYRQFYGNTSQWFWIILSENKSKGLEIYPSEMNYPEFGSRLDFPALYGYLGFTAHYRPRVDHFAAENVNEFRAAIDGRWDWETGIWFESAVSLYREDSDEDYAYLTFGTDYSLAGITLTAEHQIISSAIYWEGNYYSDRLEQTTALTGDYSLNILDGLNLSLFYSHISEELSTFISWQRTYDYFIINFGLFKFPDNQDSLYSGMGAMLGLQYNM